MAEKKAPSELEQNNIEDNSALDEFMLNEYRGAFGRSDSSSSLSSMGDGPVEYVNFPSSEVEQDQDNNDQLSNSSSSSADLDESISETEVQERLLSGLKEILLTKFAMLTHFLDMKQKNIDEALESIKKAEPEDQANLRDELEKELQTTKQELLIVNTSLAKLLDIMRRHCTVEIPELQESQDPDMLSSSANLANLCGVILGGTFPMQRQEPEKEEPKTPEENSHNFIK